MDVGIVTAYHTRSQGGNGLVKTRDGHFFEKFIIEGASQDGLFLVDYWSAAGDYNGQLISRHLKQNIQCDGCANADPDFILLKRQESRLLNVNLIPTWRQSEEQEATILGSQNLAHAHQLWCGNGDGNTC